MAHSATEMPQLMSAALFERDDRLLAVHRKPERAPFPGKWLVPATVVGEHETAEDALRRHAREQFGVTLGVEQFVDTVYVEDVADGKRYVANIFRAPIAEGPLRFNAAGDYDDARWLAAAELRQVDVPEDLREPLVRILTEPEEAPVTDWESMPPEAAAAATPLAEREAPPAPAQPPPDNREAWNTIARAYQDERYGDRHPGRLRWSYGMYEDELRLLGDVRAKHAIVLGCGGGQDVVALDKMGAMPIGIDFSREQIAYAKRYAERHGAENASFVEGDITDLSRFDGNKFELAISIHVLDYVERIDRVLSETARVLKTGGILVISVPHPFDVTDRYLQSYWDRVEDWTRTDLGETTARFRSYHRTISEWFGLLTQSGFAVERIVEPRQDAVDDERDEAFAERARRMPYVIIFVARKR